MRILLLIFLCFSTSTAFALTFSGKVVNVSDGDSIQVLREGKVEKVRLAGIDCPEKDQPFGQAAKRFALVLVAHKIVTVEVETKDRYGRTVGEVILPDGSSLNRRLVEEGYAWWYRRYSKDNSLGDLESKAQTNKKGLWVDKTPIAPWEWRKGRKTNPGHALLFPKYSINWRHETPNVPSLSQIPITHIVESSAQKTPLSVLSSIQRGGRSGRESRTVLG